MSSVGETVVGSYFNKSFPSLPAIFTLDLTRQGILVENLKAEHLGEVYDLVTDGAHREDNVGTDEFPTLEDFHKLYIYSTMLSFRDVQTLKLKAVIVIEPCRLSRSVNPYLATIYVFTCAQYSQKPFWRDLARLAQRFTTEIKLGYGACVTNVFSTCLQRVLAFREEGFFITACIHDAGKLRGSENYVHSYVLHKDFGLGEIPKLPLDVIRKLADDDCGQVSKFAPKTVSFVPVEHMMPDGRLIVIRNMHPSETDLYYSMYDRGFGLDEWPTKRYFVEKHLQFSYNFVVEDQTTGNWIAAMNIMSSAYARGRSSKLCDMVLAFGREFIGKGYGTEFAGIGGWVAHRIGFTAIHSDCVISNPAALGLCQNNGLTVTGVIPKSIYFADQGWVDTVLVYTNIDRFMYMKKPETNCKV